MNYYVIQILKGATYAHGPYKTEAARDHRYENTMGGEIHAFESHSDDPGRAIQEFKEKRL